ncbi:MAG: DUF5666 domain-containing protein [Acidimicrobiales bacterium]
MKTSSLKVVGRSASVLAIGVALTAVSTSTAIAATPRTNAANHGDSSATVSARDNADLTMVGYVTALTPTSVSVLLRNGTSVTFAITSATTFSEGTSATTVASLAIGQLVRVQTTNPVTTTTTSTTTSSATATSIEIELARLSGIVTAVSGDSITVANEQGFTHTIVVSSTTTFALEGSSATLANVVVGSRIHATGVIGTDGTTLDAMSVLINPYHQSKSSAVTRGDVTAVTSTSLTVSGRDGVLTTFLVTPTTIFSEGRTQATFANVSVGEQVSVLVSPSSPTTALRVSVMLSRVEGVVTAVSGDAITVKSHHGDVQTIAVSTSTTFSMRNNSATLADVVVGARVRAEGVADVATSTLNASAVQIHNVPNAKKGDMGKKGRGDQKKVGARGKARVNFKSHGWSGGLYVSAR